MRALTASSILRLIILVIVLINCSISGIAGQKQRSQTGLAKFYAANYDGEKTASGKKFDKDEYVAAHPSLPLGTIVRVVNLENNREVKVRIIDRGPVKKERAKGVIVDLSHKAAEALDFVKKGTTRVRLEVIE